MPDKPMPNSVAKVVPRRTAPKQSTQQAITRSNIEFASGFNAALTRTKACEPNLEARTKLLFEMVVEFCRPKVAISMGSIESRPISLAHHEAEVTDLQAIEIRQSLLDEIINHTQSEAISRAFLKRYQGEQLAVIAVPCRSDEDQAPFAVIALAIAATQSQIIREVLQFVEALSKLALDLTQSTKETPSLDTQQLDRLIKASSYESDLALAFQIVNAVATKFNCEQVALGLAQRDGVRLTAISGTSSIKRNSPGTILLERAMDECFDQNELVSFPRLKHNANTAAPGIHQALSKASGHASFCSLPVSDGQRCVAVVTLRRANGDTFSEEELERLKERLLPCGPAFQTLSRASRNLKEHAKESLVCFGKGLLTNNTKLALASFAAVLLGYLLFGRMIYQPSCSAELAAAQLQHVAAPLDGIIQSVNVHSGQQVTPGTSLVVFDTDNMLLEKNMLLADIGEATVDMKTALTQNDPKGAALQQAKIESIRAKLDNVEARLARAHVNAPSAGRVVRCDLRTKIGQEFKFGMPLLELAIGDTWKIQIEVPDTVAPYVTAGQVGYFAPFGRPGESYPFEIESINGQADVKNGKNVFVANAMLELPNGTPTDWMKVGMSGVAKIKTESRPVFWVYFHDALDWLHKAIWY